jgi:hypothetical protein
MFQPLHCRQQAAELGQRRKSDARGRFALWHAGHRVDHPFEPTQLLVRGDEVQGPQTGIHRQQRTGQLVVIARVLEQARLEHRLGQLLDEQRHAVGLGHDLRRDLVRQGLVPDHPRLDAHREVRLQARAGIAVVGDLVGEGAAREEGSGR